MVLVDIRRSIICEKLNIPPQTRVRELSEDDTVKIREIIDADYRVEGDLRREVAVNIKRLTDLGCYRGLRHRKRLACSGATDTYECAYP